MRHQWRDGNCLGPIKVCQRCPVIWWVWAKPTEPQSECVPIEDVSFASAAPTGEVA